MLTINSVMPTEIIFNGTDLTQVFARHNSSDTPVLVWTKGDIAITNNRFYLHNAIHNDINIYFDNVLIDTIAAGFSGTTTLSQSLIANTNLKVELSNTNGYKLEIQNGLISSNNWFLRTFIETERTSTLNNISVTWRHVYDDGREQIDIGAINIPYTAKIQVKATSAAYFTPYGHDSNYGGYWEGPGATNYRTEINDANLVNTNLFISKIDDMRPYMSTADYNKLIPVVPEQTDKTETITMNNWPKLTLEYYNKYWAGNSTKENNTGAALNHVFYSASSGDSGQTRFSDSATCSVREYGRTIDDTYDTIHYAIRCPVTNQQLDQIPIPTKGSYWANAFVRAGAESYLKIDLVTSGDTIHLNSGNFGVMNIETSVYQETFSTSGQQVTYYEYTLN